MKIKILLLGVLALASLESFALDIDEKLTFRVLSLSSTKKTLLMNRGLEDGLVVGDHAKFFLTTGVIARGVVVKASPSRSIWSVYRMVDETQILVDKVLNLKIASPVKVTEDPTKSLKEESTVEGEESLDIPPETAQEKESKKIFITEPLHRKNKIANKKPLNWSLKE